VHARTCRYRERDVGRNIGMHPEGRIVWSGAGPKCRERGDASGGTHREHRERRDASLQMHPSRVDRDRSVRREGMHPCRCIAWIGTEASGERVCIRKDASRKQCRMHARQRVSDEGDPGWGRGCILGYAHHRTPRQQAHGGRYACRGTHAQNTEVHGGSRSPGCILTKPLTSG
jgi:hypothetical protein